LASAGADAVTSVRTGATPARSSIVKVERRWRGSTSVTTVPDSPARAARAQAAQGVERDRPVGRELATGDRDHSASPYCDHVPP